MSSILVSVLTLAAALFVLGAIGFLTRRNLILMFLSLELMLAGVSMNFIAFGYHYGVMSGQVIGILILTVASCEAALALALIVSLYRRFPTLDVGEWSQLGEASKRSVLPSDFDELADEEAVYPKLTPAGPQPQQRPV